MAGFADGRFAMVVAGLGDAFWLAPLANYSSERETWKLLGLDSAGSVYWAARSAPLGVTTLRL